MLYYAQLKTCPRKKLFVEINFLGKNEHSLGWAQLCSISKVILTFRLLRFKWCCIGQHVTHNGKVQVTPSFTTFFIPQVVICQTFKGSFFSKRFVQIFIYSDVSSIFPLKIWQSLYFQIPTISMVPLLKNYKWPCSDQDVS